jgi:hypothetical protein
LHDNPLVGNDTAIYFQASHTCWPVGGNVCVSRGGYNFSTTINSHGTNAQGDEFVGIFLGDIGLAALSGGGGIAAFHGVVTVCHGGCVAPTTTTTSAPCNTGWMGLHCADSGYSVVCNDGSIGGPWGHGPAATYYKIKNIVTNVEFCMSMYHTGVGPIEPDLRVTGGPYTTCVICEGDIILP